MAAAIIPFRIGEIVRPYLIKKKKDIPLSSAFATVFIERFFDILILIIFLYVNLFYLPDLPGFIIEGGKIFLGIILLTILFIVLLVFKTETAFRLINPILKRFPEKYSTFINNILKNFISGFAVISNIKSLFLVFIFSFLLWFINTVSLYLLFYLCNLKLPFIASLLVLVITALGISLPAAPGFLGNFQYASILALTYFNVPKTEAFAFSIVSYLAGVGIVILLGFIFLFFEKSSFKDLISFRSFTEGDL